MTVRIVTDSSCDLPQDLVDQHGIRIVPLSIRFGEDELLDREQLSPEEFYRRLETSEALPETAAPAPGAFEVAFRAAADEGATGVVCINLSSGLSATYQSAVTAAKALEGQAVPIRVIDSRAITMGLGNLCLQAAAAAEGGASVDEVADLVTERIPRTRTYGALDTLEFLKKGGRIGGAQALLGSLLSIKPVLDLSSGEVEPESKQRTRAKALRHLVELVDGAGEVEHLAVMHGNAPDLDQLLDLLGERHPRDQIVVGTIGATIGTHGGPRVIGVTFQVAG